MKLFAFLMSIVVANPMMNFFLMEKLNEGGDDDSLMKMLLFSPGLLGQNQAQGDQMGSLLPFLLLNDEQDLDNSKMLMMMLMQQPGTDMNTMLPLLMADNQETDMMSLFLMVSNTVNYNNSTVWRIVIYNVNLDNNDAIKLRINE